MLYDDGSSGSMLSDDGGSGLMLYDDDSSGSVLYGDGGSGLMLHDDSGSDRRDGVVVRASASHSVDLAFIPLVESYQKTLKNGIHSFPAWRLTFRRGCGEQAGKFACCVLGQGT